MARHPLLVGIIASSCALLCQFSPAAQGDTISLAYVGLEAGGTENVTYNSTNYNVINGLLKLNTQNPVGPLASAMTNPEWIFCFELNQFADGNYNTYNVQYLGSTIGSTKAEMIRQLWAQHYSAGWESNTLIFTNNWAPGQPANTAENVNTLAMNLSIYEIAYDYSGPLSSLNLAAGNFTASSTNPAAITTANTWLSALVLDVNYSGPKANLLSLTNANKQDYIVEIPPPVNVPEPASAALLILSSSCILLRRR